MVSVLICEGDGRRGRRLAAALRAAAADLEVLAVTTTAKDVLDAASELFPDCVVIDLGLGDVTGVDAIRRLRQLVPTTTVVAHTASDDQHDVYRAVRAGASGYVVRDGDVTELAGVIRSVANGHLVIPAHLVDAFMEDLGTSRVVGLAEWEREIMASIARGETNREIARALRMSERTVRRQIQNLYSKLHLTDRVAAAIDASKTVE